MQALLDQMTPLADETMPALATQTGFLKGVFTELAPAVQASGAMASGSVPFWQEHGKAIQNVGVAFDGLSRVAEMAGNKTMSAIASIASTTAQAFAAGGPWAAAVTFATSTLAALGNKLFKTEGKQVNDMRDGFVAAAGGLAALNEKAHAAGMTLDALLKADTVKEYEAAVKALEAAWANQANAAEQAANDAAAAIERQMAALDKYGLSWTQAGEAIKAATMSGQVDGLLQDLNDLTAAGVEWDTAVEAMGGAFSKMVTDAMASGQQLPESLRPIIEHLREVGLLEDGTAKKIDEVTQKYKEQADAVEANFSKQIEAVKNNLASIDQQLAALNASEAPEEIMGSVEAAARKKLEEEKKLEQEKLKALETQKDTELAAIEASKNKEVEDIKKVAVDFEKLFKDTASKSAESAAEVARQWQKEPWADWQPPDWERLLGGYWGRGGGGGGNGGGGGGTGGESFHQTLSGLGAQSGGGGTMHVHLNLDGKRVTTAVIRNLGGRLSLLGAR